jgi:hypothetical protein
VTKSTSQIVAGAEVVNNMVAQIVCYTVTGDNLSLNTVLLPVTKSTSQIVAGAEVVNNMVAQIVCYTVSGFATGDNKSFNTVLLPVTKCTRYEVMNCWKKLCPHKDSTWVKHSFQILRLSAAECAR